MFTFFLYYSRHDVELLLISSERRYRFEGDLSVVNLYNFYKVGRSGETPGLRAVSNPASQYLYIRRVYMCCRVKFPLYSSTLETLVYQINKSVGFLIKFIFFISH